MELLDLEQVRTSPESRIFSGRDAGEAARRRFELDRLEKNEGHFVVRIPQDALAVNLSFFLGLFGPSVRRRGADGFREAFTFEAKPVHAQTINEGIRRALTESAVLFG